jgi:hypothetical protein
VYTLAITVNVTFGFTLDSQYQAHLNNCGSMSVVGEGETEMTTTVSIETAPASTKKQEDFTNKITTWLLS